MKTKNGAWRNTDVMGAQVHRAARQTSAAANFDTLAKPIDALYLIELRSDAPADVVSNDNYGARLFGIWARGICTARRQKAKKCDQANSLRGAPNSARKKCAFTFLSIHENHPT